MGRDIRFRQPLRKKTGEFIEWFYWNIFISPAIQQNGLDTRKESQQYIGIKDGSGKDIYEGDIIKQRGQRNTFVEYHKGAWVLRYDDDKAEWRQDLKDKFHLYIEIIGNIYENPEKLKND